LASQFPDLRRFIREGYVRYAFSRFGVPYVVSIQCLDSAPRTRARGRTTIDRIKLCGTCAAAGCQPS